MTLQLGGGGSGGVEGGGGMEVKGEGKKEGRKN